MDRSLRAKRLTGALLDRLTPHVHILEMNGRATASSAAGRVPHRKLRMDRRRLTSPTLSTRPLASSTALPVCLRSSSRRDTITPPRWPSFSPPLTGPVPFPLEYALYRIPVSPARHSRASGNPELEAAFQYRQDQLETVLEVWPESYWPRFLLRACAKSFGSGISELKRCRAQRSVKLLIGSGMSA